MVQLFSNLFKTYATSPKICLPLQVKTEEKSLKNTFESILTTSPRGTLLYTTEFPSSDRFSRNSFSTYSERASKFTF